MNLTKFRHGTSTNNRINRSCDRFDGMTVSLTEKRENLLLKQIKITAEYVPGILSTRAKWQCSHSKTFPKLKLSPIVLESIHKEIEMPITPMFASRLLNQIEKYIFLKTRPTQFGYRWIKSDISERAASYGKLKEKKHIKKLHFVLEKME